MIMARSSAARCGRPGSGGVRAVMASQVSNSVFGASGRAMQGSSAGTPGCCCGQVSSLPTKSRLAPLCSSTKRTVSAVSVGKIATVVWPAIQMASSAMMKCAQFFDRMAMRAPGSNPRCCRCAAMRRAWSSTWAQV